jgi:UDP-N-acetylmuramate dehydrogenase
MVHIKENFSLKQYNTFGIDVKARYFTRVESLEQLKEVLEARRDCFPFYIMGGGSNILFTKDYNGIIIQPAIKGINVIDDDLEQSVIEVGAGEKWDDFVIWAVENNLGGIENLSIIPGSTGSSPIQNIGAYGAEVKDVIERVNYLDLETFELVSLANNECHFGYRSSIFKNQLKNRAVVTSVVFRLRHNPVFNISYGNLREVTEKMGDIKLETVRNAVIHIRMSKLPDPELLGNAGSFFKNPVVEASIALQLKDRHNSMPLFPVSDDLIKIPAGWLIEQCGWKGKRAGNAGVHEKQALVLVNYGNASGDEIRNLAWLIRDSVFSTFDILLEPR